MMRSNGQKLEALGFLQAMLPEAKQSTTDPSLYGGILQEIVCVLLDLDWYQQAHEAATELVAFAKAKFGLEDPRTLTALKTYASACAELGRVEEAKAHYEDVLTTHTRVLGPTHRDTQHTLRSMRHYGFAEPSG